MGPRRAAVTDREAIAAGHRAVLRSGAGNVGLACYMSSAQVVWRRSDALGEHAELSWCPAREQVAHMLITDAGGEPVAFPAG